MQTLSLVLFVLSLAIYVQANCGPYERPIINMLGEVKCIPKPGSCDDKPDFVETKACDERGPCFDFRVCYYKHLRTQCFPDACDRCKPRIYDHLFREVCKDEY
ncbi:hypothetical protein M3Y97_00987000 [Aphelenchoides bicaudatus]|nr:hypothetical protein M3Y97_00987000 [Aphelenchoides bicaudatus]